MKRYFWRNLSSKLVRGDWIQRSVGGQGPNMTIFFEFWWYLFAPNSRQSAGIALKTSPIESYEFSASKLCPDFFFQLQKIYFFRDQKYFSIFFFDQKYFSVKSKILLEKYRDFQNDLQIFGIFKNSDNFKLTVCQAPGLSENVSTGFE